MQVRTSVIVSRAPEVVSDFVIAHYMENHPRWDPRVVRSELDSGMSLGPGATGKEVRHQMGRDMTYIFRVSEMNSSRLAFQATGKGTSFASTWQVDPAPAGSQVAVTFELRMAGPMKLIEPLMAGGVRKEMERATTKMKELIEAVPANP